MDTISLASVDSVEYATIDNPVVDSTNGDSCLTLQNPEVVAPAVNGVMDAGQEVSAAVVVELEQRDDNLFDIDINLLRKDEPLHELISPELVNNILSENNLTVGKTDDAKMQSNGHDILPPASSAKDKISRDHFDSLRENGVSVDDHDHLSEDWDTVLFNDYSIYSVSKSSEIHDSQEIDVTAKLFQYREQPDSIIALKLFNEHDSDRVSLQDALEFPAVESSFKPTSKVNGNRSPPSLHLPLSSSSKSTALIVVTRTAMTTWHEFSTPARLSSISVSSRHIWCTDELNRIHYSGLSGEGLQWQTLQQTTAQQIAVAPSGWIVWRLDGGSAFAAKGVSHRCPSGVEWVEVARDVAYIAVDDTEAW